MNEVVASPTAGAYRSAYRHSMEDPESFWLEAAKDVAWQMWPSSARQDAGWFADGMLNTCYNALDRHVEAGHGGQPALQYDSPVTATQRSISYSELLDGTRIFAGALADLGVGRGDRVLIYMPMIPEAVVAMLACARLGAVHSVVFGGFAAPELANRIDDATPVLILTASCGVEPARVVEYKPLLDRALELAKHRPPHCVVKQRPQCIATLVAGRDLDWEEFAARGVDAPADCVPVAGSDPLYILYTSGTTAKPKGIVRDNAGHAVALTWAMRNIFEVGRADVMWAASDIGWVVGHSFMVYAPLLAGATTVLYEGKPVGTPDAGAFWRVVEQHGVNALLTAPTAIRAIKKADPEGEHAALRDLSGLRNLFLAGERLDPATYEWVSSVVGAPVIDNWWQTETGWPIAANPRGLERLPIKPGSPSVPVPGYDVRILGQDGNEVAPGEEGAICIRLPLPPGALATVWGDHERFRSTYLTEHPGYYLTGDGGYLDADGYVFVMGRTDDVINVAGHRLSTGSMEAVIAGHPSVAECAVIGVHDQLKGQVPHAFVVVKDGVDAATDLLTDALKERVRDEIGAIATLRAVDLVRMLPKTRSGKILRATMRTIVDGGDPEIPSTIEDASALDTIRDAVRSCGSAPDPR